MNEHSCFSCGNLLPQRGFHCKKCGRQFRCKNVNCVELLEADEDFCVFCGMAISVVEKQPTLEMPQNPQTTSQIHWRHQKSKHEEASLDAELTDVAFSYLGGTLGSLITNSLDTGKITNGRPPRNGNATPTNQLALPGTTPEGHTEKSEDVVDTAFTDNTQAVAQGNTDEAKMKRIFRMEGDNGDQLALEETRLKASGKLDYSKRLTYLFLYAHELAGHTFVSRALLNAIVEKQAANDANYRNWFAHSSDIRREDDQIRLVQSGREEAVKVLSEVLDASTDAGWMPDATGRTKRGKENTSTEGQSNPAEQPTRRKANTPSKGIKEWVGKWKSLGLDVDGHKAVKDRTNLDKALFGLWAIRLALNEVGKQVSRDKLAQFLWEAFEIRVNGRNLETALKSKAAEGKVEKVTGITFQILPPGMEHAERIANSSPIALVAPSSGKPETAT